MVRSFIISLSLLLLGTSLSAQENKAEINVLGNAMFSVKPTQVVISYNIRAKHAQYVGAIEALIKRVDALSDELKKMKFKEEDIITTNFNVVANRYYDRGEQKEDGFIASQQLRVQFDQDNKLLLQVLSKTTASQADAEITLSFTVDEETKEEITNKLIKRAVKNAKMKAQIIADESGYEIMGIKEVNYGMGGAQPYYKSTAPQVEMMSVRSSDVQFSNMEAADLTFSDQVNVVYYIRKVN